MTKVLQLSLLGRLRLSRDDAPIDDLVSAKAQALLCYLAVTGQPHSRQALATLLWGEVPESDARRNLRGALLKLRQSIESHLVVTHQTLAFNRQRPYWLDVSEFEEKTSYRTQTTPDQLQEAVRLYRGSFLADFYVRQAPDFDEWVYGQRIRLHERALNAYLELARHDAESGDYERSIFHARRLLHLEPAREDGHRQLMLALALNGQRSAALAQFDTCRQTLRDELDVEPAAETHELYERIRTGQISAQVKTAVPTAAAAQTAAPILTAAFNDPTPFIVGPPITHPRHFFGRERELKRLFNLFRRLPLQNAAIIGPRRSGKTSLLHYLRTVTTTDPGQLRPEQRTDWLPSPEQYRWIFVDFQDPRLGSSASLLQHLLTHMDLPVPDPCDVETFLDIVSDNLDAPTIILLDEIGVALERYPELDDMFWESLRSLATNQVGGNLGFVLTAPQPPHELAQHGGLGSPFFNIFGYTAVLPPFAESEARNLIASSPIPFPEADIEWMLAESEQWPILLQILCRERLLALEEEDDTHAWREDGLRQIAPFKRMLHD